MRRNSSKQSLAARERLFNRLNQQDLIPGFPREVVAVTVSKLLSHAEGNKGYSSRLRRKLREVYDALSNGGSAYTENFANISRGVQGRPYDEQMKALAPLLSPEPVPTLHFSHPHGSAYKE